MSAKTINVTKVGLTDKGYVKILAETIDVDTNKWIKCLFYKCRFNINKACTNKSLALSPEKGENESISWICWSEDEKRFKEIIDG